MQARISSKPQSAGLLLFRQVDGDIEVLLGHPGGPFWKRKDHGAWSIPKGLIAAIRRLDTSGSGLRPMLGEV